MGQLGKHIPDEKKKWISKNERASEKHCFKS